MRGSTARDIQVWKSNRVEQLVDALAGLLRRPSDDPFVPQVVGIPSRGMESWLEARLAEKLGVCAGVEFPFPGALLRRAFVAALGDEVRGVAAWEPEPLTWAVLAVLPGLLERTEFGPVRRYLADDARLETPRGVRFARRVAESFDRYHAYRPEMCKLWRTRGPTDDWQPVLWNALRERLGTDPVEVAGRFEWRCEDPSLRLRGLPDRLALFGVSMLPPQWLRLLRSLARRVEVHLFVPTPSAQYWGDLRTRRDRLRDLRRADEDGIDPQDLHLDDGHRVLAAFGRLGRDFQVTLEQEEYGEVDVDLFEAPEPTSTLTRLQSDLMSLRTTPNDEVDRSIEVHSCHGPMRQVEVLHDRLLEAFSGDASIEPHDVLVMTPDLETYAPLIEAVFGTEREGQKRVPFRIADRPVRQESAVADAFVRLVELAGSRLTATELFDVLSLPAVCAKFGLDAEDLDRAADWIRESGIRWGIDASHRAAAGQPETSANTWRFGLDRLLLGVAMRGDGHRTFEGVLPIDSVEGSDARVLGGLSAFVEAITVLQQRLEGGARPLAAWIDALLGSLTITVQDEANAWEHEAVRVALLGMVDEAGSVGFGGALDLSAARDLVTARLDRPAGGAVFSSGGVTFCAMIPMRSVPYAVVVLLGLDDGAFPRRRPEPSFDLIAASPRVGDRSRRDEDRQLFLEAILAARQRLLIFHTGKHVRTNERLPPSVVVSELVDALGGEEKVSRVEHPLQAFSPDSFREDRPERQSFRDDLVAGARAIMEGGHEPVPFVADALEAPERDDAVVVTIDDVIGALVNPAKTLLRQRLRVSFWEREDGFLDREPFEPDGLAKWQVRNAIYRRLEREPAADDLETAVRAAGRLPLGTSGEMLLHEAVERMSEFSAVADGRGRGAVEPLEVDLEVGGVRLVGSVPRVAGRDELLVVRDSSFKAKYLLGAWVAHLAAHAQTGRAFTTRTVHYRTKGEVSEEHSLGAVPDALEGLEFLVRFHQRACREAVPFEPAASEAYVKKDGGPDGMAAARKAWQPDDFRPVPGGSEDPYFERVFDVTALPDHAEFASLARMIFDPIHDALDPEGT